MWIRYTEVTVIPEPKKFWGPNQPDVDVFEWRAEDAMIFHTGRFEEEKIKYKSEYGENYKVSRHRRWVDGVHIAVDIKGGSDDAPNEATIKMYNVHRRYTISNDVRVKSIDPELYDSFVIGMAIVVKTGYLDYYDSIFIGKVESIELEYEGQDQITILKCKDDANLYLNGTIAKPLFWFSGTKVAKVAKDICKSIGMPIGYIVDDGTVIPAGGFTSSQDTSIKANFDYLSHVGGISNYIAGITIPYPAYKYYMKQGRFYWVTINQASPFGWLLTFDSGLLSFNRSEVEKGKYDWHLKLMMIPGICEDSLIFLTNYKRSITDSDYTHLVRALKIKEFHYMSDDQRHGVDLKCKLVTLENAFKLGNMAEVREIETVNGEEELELEEWLERQRALNDARRRWRGYTLNEDWSRY